MSVCALTVYHQALVEAVLKGGSALVELGERVGVDAGGRSMAMVVMSCIQRATQVCIPCNGNNGCHVKIAAVDVCYCILPVQQPDALSEPSPRAQGY